MLLLCPAWASAQIVSPGGGGPAALPVNNPTFTGTLSGPSINISSLGGSCSAGQFMDALSTTGAITCATPAGGGTGTLPVATGPYLTLQSDSANNPVWNKHVGIDTAPVPDDANGSYFLTAKGNLNNQYEMTIQNLTAGNNAATALSVRNDLGSSDAFTFGETSSLTTWGGIWGGNMGFIEAFNASGMLLYSDNGPITLNTVTANQPIRFFTDGNGGVRQMQIDTTGIQVGSPTGSGKGVGTINVAGGYYVNGVALAGLNGSTASVGFDFAGSVAASSIAAFTCGYALTIPANFTSPNSYVTCGTNPSEADAYTVKVNGATVGTITLSTTCVATLGTATATTCAAGQRMEIDAPATVSGKDVAITIGVTR
jgi:hypothetical protein